MILRIKNLSVRLKTDSARSVLLNGVNIAVKKNTICALVGDSGSGKSLIAAATLGVLAENLCAQGDIFFAGKNILGMTEKELRSIRGREIGIVMQNCAGSLDPLLSNGRQLSLAIRAHCVGKRDVSAMAAQLLCKVGLYNTREIMNQYPHQLSGGMKQRLMTAIGIAASPQLLILDEPTKGLDLILRNQIAQMIAALHRESGCTILLITHDLELAQCLADYCYVIRDGAIAVHGKTEPLFEQVQTGVLHELLSAEKKLTDFFSGGAHAEAG